jgi:hypothetical protein
MPCRASLSVIKVFHTKDVRAFSAFTVVIPVSIPTASISEGELATGKCRGARVKRIACWRHYRVGPTMKDAARAHWEYICIQKTCNSAFVNVRDRLRFRFSITSLFTTLAN